MRITPTLSYFAGVPGAEKPFIQVTPKGDAAGMPEEAIGAKLRTRSETHPIAIVARIRLFTLCDRGVEGVPVVAADR